MAELHLRSHLKPEERQQKQRLILRDAVALLSLFAITVVLSFVTYFLFHSFSVHRKELAQRWLSRGESAMRAGQPLAAIEALRSAQAYAPDDEKLQIELAEALAAAGRTSEAVAYFNTLLESQPGNGMINLQLARLAARTTRLRWMAHGKAMAISAAGKYGWSWQVISLAGSSTNRRVPTY
jgi:predicted Zn-dependent protease